MTNADTVYASPTSLYVATSGGWQRDDTSIHRFDLTGDADTAYRASGQVPGDLLNQFALSEYKGVLRAATTEGFSDNSQSHVTSLQARAGRLEKIGQVSGLGRGERIYAVRFIEDRGYVVTFRQVDPLYTLDLADPAHPRVRGELKILGYSAYLHPVGDHELLGIGQDASAEGVRQGTQLSLFDVDDPANPKLLHKVALGELTSSEAEYDHHAFLWWEPLRLAVVPVSDYEGGEPAQAIGFNVDRTKGIVETGRTRETADVLRTLVIGPRLFTLTDEGLHAYDLNDARARARFTSAFVEPGRKFRPSAGCVAAPMTFSRRLFTLAAATAATLALTAAPSMAIVGGSDAAAGEYPSVTEVIIANAFLCTGTLIAPNYVLTAGHCGSITGGTGVASPAAFPPQAIQVYIGSNKPGQGENVPVSSVTVEPKYLLNSGYDITLLKLSRNSTKTPTHVVGASGAGIWSAGTLEEIVGFGTTSEGGDTPDTLQKAKVPITTDAYCAERLRRLRRHLDGVRRLPAGRHRHLPGRLRRPDVRPRRQPAR